MSEITLKKGDDITLKKEDMSPVKNLIAGIGWDSKDDKDVDVDLWIVPKEVTNAKKDILFFQSEQENSDGKKMIPGMVHSGDDLTGNVSEDGCDEMVHIKGEELDQKEYLVVANVYSGDVFGTIERCFAEMIDQDTQKSLAKFDMSGEGGDNKTLVVGKITVGDDKALSFKAIGDYSKLTCDNIVNNPSELF